VLAEHDIPAVGRTYIVYHGLFQKSRGLQKNKKKCAAPDAFQGGVFFVGERHHTRIFTAFGGLTFSPADKTIFGM